MNEVGFFGGEVYNLIDEPKKVTNMLEEFKSVFNGKVPDSTLLVPLLNWFSNEKLNIQQMQKINKNFFWCNKEILSRQLLLNINKHKSWIKYPKKGEEHELNFLIPYICRYYKWSNREYEYHKHLINLEDTKMHLELDRLYAFEKPELRKLGLKREKIKTKFEDFSKTKGFF